MRANATADVLHFPSRAAAIGRVRQMREALYGDIALFPVTPAGDIDLDAIATGGFDWFTGSLDTIPDADIPRLGILIDTFGRFLPDAPMGVRVAVLDRGGDAQVTQIDELNDHPLAVEMVREAIATGKPLREREKRSGSMLEALRAQAAADGDVRPSGARFQITWLSEIAETAPKEAFIKGVLGDGELTTVSGLPGSGKSVILTDMACHVAAGMEWHGRRVKQGLVVYVAAERKKLTERRMMAFRERHGLEGHEPLAVLGGRLDFTSSLRDARDLVAAIRDAEGQCGEPCVWIIVDTLTRTFGPGDQNASKDMGRFIMSLDVLLETGAHVTVVHHTAWSGERGKGAIDLDGAVDASFMVKKDGGSYVLICDGTNDGEEGVVCRFKMEGVQVGVDEEGEPTMAPVVVPAADLGETLVARAKGHATKALEILSEASRRSVKLSEDDWRAAFYAAYPDTKTHALKMRFQRARKALLDSSAACHHDGEYWVPIGGTDGTCAADVPCAV